MFNLIAKIYFKFLLLGDFLLFTITILFLKKDKMNKVLLIRLDALGDFILWLDAAKEFRKLYSPEQYKITLLGNKNWTELAKDLPYWDEVWDLDRNRFLHHPLYRWQLLWKIKMFGFNIAIQPAFSREFYFGDAVIRASSASERIGFEGDLSNITPTQKEISDQWYTKLIPASPDPLMELERNAEFLRGLGLATFQVRLPTLSLKQSQRVVTQEDKPYYILFPGAMWRIKQWPIDHFAEIVKRIFNQSGMQGIVCGSSQEKTLAEQLMKQCPSMLKNYTGRTTLVQLTSLIKNARFVLGNDTGPLHMAVALDIPTICILGGGHFGRFLPYQYQIKKEFDRPPVAVFHKMDCFNCSWHCIYPLNPNQPSPCIGEIKVEDVWRGVQKLL